MKKQNRFTLLAAAVLGITATAHANLTWNWTLSQSGLNNGDVGHGTFTTGPLTSEGYLVTGASGIFDGNTVTGVVDYSDATGAGWDQLLFPSDADPAGALVDLGGIVLTISGSSNAYAGFYNPEDPSNFSSIHDVFSGEINDLTSPGVNHSLLSALMTVTPAPEPSQVVSMLGLAGLGGLGLLGRLRSKK